MHQGQPAQPAQPVQPAVAPLAPVIQIPDPYVVFEQWLKQKYRDPLVAVNARNALSRITMYKQQESTFMAAVDELDIRFGRYQKQAESIDPDTLVGFYLNALHGHNNWSEELFKAVRKVIRPREPNYTLEDAREEARQQADVLDQVRRETRYNNRSFNYNPNNSRHGDYNGRGGNRPRNNSPRRPYKPVVDINVIKQEPKNNNFNNQTDSTTDNQAELNNVSAQRKNQGSGNSNPNYNKPNYNKPNFNQQNSYNKFNNNNSGKRIRGPCYNCGKMGHLQFECRVQYPKGMGQR